MTVWRRLKAIGAFWMNDAALADGARYKSRLVGPMILAGGVVSGIARSWGILTLCLIVGLLLIAHGWSGRRNA